MRRCRFFALFLAAVAGVVLATTAAADVPCADYRLPIHSLGTVPTPAGSRDVAMIPGWAYVLEGDRGVTVIDLADPSAPAVATRLELPADATDLAVTQGQLLVTLRSAGLAAYDLASPAAPTYLGTLGTIRADHVAADGPLVWVAGDSLRVLAAVPGGPPVRTGAFYDWQLSGAVAVSGSRAYNLGSSVTLFDLSDPAHPRLAGSENWWTDCYHYTATAAVARGAILYTARSWYDVCYGPNGGEVAVTDFSDPASPHTGARQLWGTGGLAVAGDVLYAADHGPLLRAFDLTQPLTPHLAGMMPLAHPPSSLACAGGVACVTEGPLVEVVAIVEQAARPAPLGSFADTPWATDARLLNGRAYVIDWEKGLCIFDLAEPSQPTLIATIPIEGALRVAVSPGRLYVLASPGSVLRLLVHALDGAGVPVLLGQADLPDYYQPAIEARGRFLWTAGLSGISVWDCRDGALPVRVHGWNSPGTGLAIDGDRLYTAGQDSLRVFALTDSTTLTLLGRKGGCGSQVAAEGGHVCVLGHVYDLRPVDVSDPAAPVFGPAVLLPCMLNRSLTVTRGVAVVAGGPDGVHFVDIRDPAAPVWLGTVDLGTDCRAAPADGEVVLVAGYGAGHVIRAPCPTSVPVFLSGFRAWREAQTVRIAWSVASGEPVGGSGAEFRLLGVDGSAEWVVPYRRTVDSFTANDASPLALRGVALTYRLSFRENGGPWTRLGEVSVPAAAPPAQCGLLSAHPNPFNPRLQIAAAVDRARDVRITIHDLAGRLVARLHDGPMAAGTRSLTWDGLCVDGRPAASGIYFVRMKWATGTSARRVVLAR